MSKLITDFNKAAQVEFSYRTNPMLFDTPAIKTSQEAYDFLMQDWSIDNITLQEQFKIILLNQNFQCISLCTVATGGIAGCLVDIRLVFVAALKVRAYGVIIAHNHLCGKKGFSEDDIRMTSRLVQVGQLMEIPVYDHLIVTEQGYTSFKDEGFMLTVKQRQP